MPQAEAIAKALGGAHRSGRGWIARCPAHNDRKPSLSLADGKNGCLLVHCFGGCDYRAVLAALRHRGIAGFPSSALASPPPAPSLDWSPKAEAIFKASRPLHGSPVEIYLLGRNCALPETDEIRYLPSRFPHPYPVMLSRITDAATGKPISLHITRITRDGKGKAPVEPQKLLLKGHRKTGGVIRLVDNADVTHGLGICEGIETGLAVMRSGWRPVWAYVDAGNLAAFPVLPGIKALTIFADNDESGRGLKAANASADRWLTAGREASIVMPRTVGTDWNDIMRGVQA